VLVGDQQGDGLVFVGTADPDVVEAAEAADSDPAGLVDAVVADAIVGGRGCDGRSGLDACVEGVHRRVAVERAVWPVLVVVGAEGVELRLEDGDRCGRCLFVEEALLGLMEALDLAAGLGWYGVECLATMPRRSSSDSRSTLPLRDLPLKTAPLSVRKAAG
jgi:hypothetical protein